MKQVLNVFKYEFLRYFNSPLAFVYLITFLLLNGSCAIYLGHFLERGIADLNPMFAYLPWLFLLFIPAVTMRLFSEEYKSNTIYQTLSLPISVCALTIGKFLSAWAFCILGLFLTFEFWLTLNVIATPDNGVIFNAYIASIILSGALCSISLFASSITKNQVIALIIGVFLILFFFLTGLDFVLGFYKLFLGASFIELVANFSMLSHYSLMIQGLVEVKAILFFISIIILFNFFTIMAIKSKFSNKSNYKLFAFVAFLGFIGFNLISSQFIGFLEITKDKRFSLSQSTKEILSNIKEPITGKLYYSEILSKESPKFRELFNNVKTTLKQYQKLSNGNFKLEIIHPKTLSQEEDIAIANGLKGMPIIDTNQSAFFGLVLTDTINNKQIVELFTPNKQNIIESTITQKIYLLNHKKANIGIITGLDMFESVIGGVATQNWQIINELKNFYNIKRIDNKNPKIEDISALMIIAPKDLSDELVKNINTYKENGGKFLILLDPAPEAFRNFAPQTAAIQATDFKDLDKSFGFKFLKQFFVADLDNSISVDVTIDYSQNPIITQDVAQVLLKEANINQAYSPTKGLKQILLSSASVIVPTNDNVEFIPLLTTSKNAGLMDINYIYQNTNPAIILANFKKDDYQKFMAAKIIQKNSKNPFEAIVITDSDFIYDSFLNSTNNLYFILNSLDELISNQNLLSLRSKSSNTYRLDMIEDIRKSSQLEYAIKENALLFKLNQVKQNLNELIGKKVFEERQEFIADELAIIAKLRQSLSALKDELGELKQNSYQKLNNIKNLIIFINIYLLPAILLLALLFTYKKTQTKKQKTKIILNKKGIIFITSCLILFAFGIFLNIEKTQSQATKELLANTNISSIDKIVISTQNKTLELYKKENQWLIKGKEDYPVYQSRIKSLLSAIAVATYYEKKSDKIKNLPYFNLDEKNATQIKLFKNNQQEKDFYIGDYNIDLGRGTAGAFYRSANNYEVWLIKADLIDISPNWQEFTYSTLWNLRFGRAIGTTAELIKDMINTPLISATPELKNAKKKFDLNINTEKKPINISFYQKDGQYFIKYNFNKTYYQISKEDYNKIKKEAGK